MNRRQLSSKEVKNAIRLYANNLFNRLILLPLPTDGVCPSCKTYTFALVELGYDRASRMTLEDGGWEATSDGWDDMSEDGDEEFVECASCGTMFETPPDLKWPI